MDNTMSESEFNAMREADARSDNTNQSKIDDMSIIEFLRHRSMETIKVPIHTQEGTKIIEIRARLTHTEEAKHKAFLSKFKAAIDGDIESLIYLGLPDGEEETANFLEYITCDNELNKDFWLSDLADDELTRSILLTYFRRDINGIRTNC